MTRTLMILAVGLVVSTGACRDRESARKQAPPPVAIDAGARPPVDAALDLRQHMDEHFGAVVQVERAVMRGQLAEAQDAAAYLSEHLEHAGLAGAEPFVEAVRAAGREIKAAPGLSRAAADAAHLGLQCARCHIARSAIVSFAWEPMPPDDGTIEARMRRHQWASARMWEGLIGPADELWNEGASLIASNDLDALAEAAAPKAVGVKELVAQVRVLARQAATAGTAEERATLYGQLLVTCAGCHQQARDRPGPAP